MNRLKIETEGETRIIATRRFNAEPKLVYRAHIEPELIRKWLHGPDGWTMTTCINEAKPGGKIHYAWEDGQGAGFSLTGEFIELSPYTRLVHVERMHLPDPTPDNHVTTNFKNDGEGGTIVTMRMDLPDSETRAAMLAS
ncbi:MAG: SRPBCC domain-containing protein, partial [Planctomycetota bacterium]|nr:SRPBCC domain-containing protein [Planctomycetota bacterium]